MPRGALLSLATAVCACQPTPLVLTPEPAQASSFPPSPAPSADPAARPIPASSDSAWSVLPRSVRPSEAELLATFRPFVVSALHLSSTCRPTLSPCFLTLPHLPPLRNLLLLHHLTPGLLKALTVVHNDV